jgi:hypothetical protein
MEKLRGVLDRLSNPNVVKASYVILILLALVLAGGAPDAWGLP